MFVIIEDNMTFEVQQLYANLKRQPMFRIDEYSFSCFTVSKIIYCI